MNHKYSTYLLMIILGAAVFSVVSMAAEGLWQYDGGEYTTYYADANVRVDGVLYNALPHMIGFVTEVQTVDSADTWYNISFNTSHGDILGVNFSNDNQTLTILEDGHYIITFGVGMVDTAVNPTSTVAIRVSVNSVELAGSYVEENPIKQDKEQWLEHSTHGVFSSGDYLNLQYVSSHTTVLLNSSNAYAITPIIAYGYLQKVLGE